jgi:hypothetical protein
MAKRREQQKQSDNQATKEQIWLQKYQCKGVDKEGSVAISGSNELRDIPHVVSPHGRIIPSLGWRRRQSTRVWRLRR